MPNSNKQKITDEDIQAYLLGEGSTDIYAKIQEVDEASITTLTGKDLKIIMTKINGEELGSLMEVH